MDKKKILVVDDEADIRQTLRIMLEKAGFLVEEAENGQVALEKIENEPSDLILLDIQMPVMTGFEVCRRLREDLDDSATYVIALTAKSEIDNRVKGLNMGINHYLTKPFNHEELMAYVRSGLQKTAKLRKSFDDTLTGLPNREAFNKGLQREIGRAKRYDSPLSLAIIDLDHFKPVNDKKGHHAGDLILISFAQLVQPIVRQGDLFFRWGGDEFGFVLPNTASVGAGNKMDEICKAVKEHDFPGIGVGVITASIGIAEFYAVDNNASLFERADKALYQAKEKRDCVVSI